MKRHVHLIAVGGAVMHNMAIALKNQGWVVTGSDDAIFEPSKGRLKERGLLPEKEGWDPDKINSNLDAVILGMHARPDNPELIKARALKLPIYSFPEFMYAQSQDCHRLVVAGSHGKTTITSMLMHSFKKTGRAFNYLVGSKIDGFDCMVDFNPEAQVAIFEGDEYLSSPIDRRSKFLHYKPNTVIITGLAWDHINVFPTYEQYLNTFELLIRDIQPGGVLIYFKGDKDLVKLVEKRPNPNIRYIGYNQPFSTSNNGETTLKGTSIGTHVLPFFGAHNLANAESARLAIQEVGVSAKSFYQYLKDYTGAARRLQLIQKKDDYSLYYDFAHAPSKVKATVAAVRAQFPKRKFIAMLELHTFSSLDQKFIPFYGGSLDPADEAWVYFSPEVLKHKKMPDLSAEEVKAAFKNDHLEVHTNPNALLSRLKALPMANSVVLLMSSGNLFHPVVTALVEEESD